MGESGFVPTPIKPTITIDDLDRVDLRVGAVVSVSEVTGSDKLVRVRVDLSDHLRTILVGMKNERADPTEIVSRQVLVVVNLAPRKMMGEVSEGMLFDIGYADGITPVLATPERSVPNATRAG